MEESDSSDGAIAIRTECVWVEYKQCRIVVHRRLSYKYQSNHTVL